MSATFHVGQRVRSAKLGDGTVRSIVDGRSLKVYFDAIGGVELVNPSAVTPLGPNPPVSPVRPPNPAQAVSAAVDLRRLTVECLRQGLPPPGKLTSWTVGHTKARRAIDAAIARAVRGEGSVLYAQAGYGQGKSHLGRLGRELAREQGLASLHVELDGEGLTLAAGTRLVSALFASALLPQVDGDHDHLVPGLGSILKRAAPLAARRLPKGLEAFAPFLKDPTRWIESEEIIEVLEEYLSGHRNRTSAAEALTARLGKKIALEPLRMDWGTSDQRRRNQAEQLKRIVQLIMLAGARGAFLVIDELDHDFQYDLEKKNLMLAELARVTQPNSMVLLLLARKLEMRGAEELDLSNFAVGELEQLVNKTIDAFAEAQPMPALGKGRAELFKALYARYKQEYEKRNWGPRFFVRATIECCEIARSRRLETLAQAMR